MPRVTGSILNTNEVAYPTSYKMDSLVLRNHEGREIDISAIVTDFSVTESIYVPSIMLSVNVKDQVNLLEEFQLSGQESLRLKLSKRRMEDQEDTEVDRYFIVTEYPTYGKFPNHLQTYTIKAISDFAYRSKFKKISRAFSGDVKDFIRAVLEHDLGVDPENVHISDRDAYSASFVVPNLEPLDAISWVLRRTYDGTGSPWYMYETFNEGIFVEPQSEMVSRNAYYTYKEGKFFNRDPYTKEDYKERRERILSLASDLRMSKYIAGSSGAYGSTSEYIDISNKTRLKTKFNYTDEYPSMVWLNRGKNNLNPSFGFDQTPLSAFNQAQINYIPLNRKAFANHTNYHHGTFGGRINRAQSYLDNLDNITHDIKIAGDFGVSPGKVVGLELRKSIDPQAKVTGENSESDYSDPFDRALSGNYLVSSVVHKFEQEYFCEVRLKKDSVNITLDSDTFL